MSTAQNNFMFRRLVRVGVNLFRRAVRCRWTTAGPADVPPTHAAAVRTAIASASLRSARSVRARDKDAQDRPGRHHRSKSSHKIVQGCVSFLAGRMPAAAVSLSHMYSPFSVFP